MNPNEAFINDALQMAITAAFLVGALMVWRWIWDRIIYRHWPGLRGRKQGTTVEDMEMRRELDRLNGRPPVIEPGATSQPNG